MRTILWTTLGVIAMATPSYAMDTLPELDRGMASTYVPGRGHGDARRADPFSQRGSSAEGDSRLRAPEPARGGGPRDERVNRSNAPVRAHRHHAIRSDNQTRRPGATNYTGQSFKPDDSEIHATHTLPSEPGVSMVGDSFGRTGSRTMGEIPTRAASSNAQTAVIPSGMVVLRTGEIEALALAGPIDLNARLAPPTDKSMLLSASDLAQLPTPGDGTAQTTGGLLTRPAAIATTRLIDSAQALVSSPSEFPAPRAFGGGPHAR